MASTSVLQNVLDGNIHKTIPASTYDDKLAATYQNIPVPQKATTFNPDVHLNYFASPQAKEKYHSTKRITLKELGHDDKPGSISPIGVSDPFPLFTQEAVDIMRSEVLQRDTFLKYARYCFNSTSGMDCTLRGYVKSNEDGIVCPFTYAAWTHPKTMALVSQMAGIELEIIMDYEIAHTNISLKSEDEAFEEKLKHQRSLLDSKTGRSMSSDGKDIPAVVGWHNDSYPFVCVLMLSDTTNMIGGETMFRMGKTKSTDTDEDTFGNVAIVPGPTQGSACVLQGRLIEHLAPSPQGVSERITMVTSYRARNPKLADTSILSTAKPEVNYGSRYNEFYGQWVGYRVELMKEKLDLVKKECRGEGDKGRFNKEETIKTLKDIEEYLAKTYKEMELTEEEVAKMYKKDLV
ncbi:uncharacterized protein LODBEIA_P33830 [Lodderomyces beijingensis]|uniref:Fe2OG dioxygenase domain-containing protein n=1 Tax=Lodderomyces beijingensis TaxID=1775926 RepID=A0ABP0ZLZ3_9ASCO